MGAIALIAMALASTAALAKASYVKAEKPITDDQGRTRVIVDFQKDAHLRYAGALPVLPSREARADVKPIEFFQTEKTLAYDATQNNPQSLVHVATMSINTNATDPNASPPITAVPVVRLP